MAGYSGTPLAAKLGIKPGATLLTIDAPKELDGWLAPLPEHVRWSAPKPKPGSVDVILCFVRSDKEVARRIDRLMAALKSDGGLWMAWPKKAAVKLDPGWATDVTENGIRAYALAAGLVDNKVCAISEVWSGLRLVYRLKDR